MSDDNKIFSTKEFIEEVWTTYKEKAQDPEAHRPVAALIPELTYKMGGFGKGMFIVFGAPPKGGKTAALLSSVTHITKIKPNALVGFISNEMWKEQLGRALLSNIAHVDRGRMKNFDLDAGEERKIEEAIMNHGQGMKCAWAWNLTKVNDVYDWIEETEQKYGAPMEYLLVDYVQLMDGEGSGPVQKVPWITRTMKQMTLKYDGMCVISASQLNADHIKRKDWSHTAFLYGGVDRDADAGIILAPHTDDYGNEVQNMKQLHLPVVREGMGGMTKITFLGQYALLAPTAPEPRDGSVLASRDLEFEL
jgi:replicative DNA helicase